MSEHWPYGTVVRYSWTNVLAMVVRDSGPSADMILIQRDPTMPSFDYPPYTKAVWTWAITYPHAVWTEVDADD